MKTDEPKLRNIIIAVFPLVLAFSLLFFVGIFSSIHAEEGIIIVIILPVAANIIAMWFPAILICQKIDKRLERLEAILDKKPKDE